MHLAGDLFEQVAAELGVSFKTVDKHRQHLMSKLNIHDVAGLTRYAIAEGIWVRGGAISNGGVVAQWASETFGIPVGDLLAQAAAVDSDGLVALPYLLGERAPWWDPPGPALEPSPRLGH
mgnify:CR=1 FL=1